MYMHPAPLGERGSKADSDRERRGRDLAAAAAAASAADELVRGRTPLRQRTSRPRGLPPPAPRGASGKRSRKVRWSRHLKARKTLLSVAVSARGRTKALRCDASQRGTGRGGTMSQNEVSEEGVAMVDAPAAASGTGARETEMTNASSMAQSSSAAPPGAGASSSSSSSSSFTPPAPPSNRPALVSESNEADGEEKDRAYVTLARQSSSMLTDPSSEVGVGDEVYMEGDVYSDMLFTYGVKTVVDAQGTRVPVELALGGKLVGVLFTSANGSDPVAKGVAFTDRLESLAAANKDTFAVLYVSQDKLEPEMTEFLSRHPNFFALPFEDKNTGETLKEALGAMEMFFPTLMVLDTTGMCISTWGRSAVMWNPKYCLMDWKNGREGVTTSQLLLHRFF